MRLQDYGNNDLYVGPNGYANNQAKSLDSHVRFSSTGFVPGVAKPPRYHRPEVHIRTDQITMENLEWVS